MKRRELMASLPLLAAPGLRAQGLSAADEQFALRLREAALADTTLAYQLIEGLCTEVGPRPAGSANDARAVAWAQRELKRIGLANVRTDEVPVTAWQRGPASATLFAPHAQPLVMLALGNSVGTPDVGVDAELVYYPDLAALRADTTERAKGKLVFIDQKMERSRDGSGYGRAVMARIAGPVEAARRGAVAIAIRSIGTDRDRLAHTGAMRYDPAVARIPAIAVSVPDADLIARHHARGTPMRLKLEMRNTSGIRAMSANVLAEVPGTGLADEVVMIGAHLDSWDQGQGALDDAAGVGIVSAAAAHIMKLAKSSGVQPKRTIRVVLFANEENGFDGANAYGAKYKAVKHQLVGESDFGAGKIWRVRSRVAPDMAASVATLAQWLQPLGIEAGNNMGNPGPDAGVLMRANLWPGIELSQDGTNYFDIHHTDNDTLDKIDPATLPQNVAAWALAAWWAAQLPQSLGPPTL
jgi:carboxypeptidase Q